MTSLSDQRDLATRSRNEAVIRRHFEALAEGDVERSLVDFADDLENHRLEPGSPPGREGLRRTLGVVVTCFPSATWTVERIVADEGAVCARVVVEGEAQGVIMGVRAEGQLVRWRHVHTFGLIDGRVISHDALRDDRGLLRQLGWPVHGPERGGLGGGLPTPPT